VISRRIISMTAATFIVAAVALPTSASAQGNGRGRPKGAKNTNTTTQPLQGAPVTPTVSFRQFGSWLDDASASTPGEGRMGIGIGHWRMSGGSQTDVPMIDVGYGLTNRTQVSASVPFYRTTYEGTTSRGLDDMYLSAKFTAIDPATNGAQFGLAVSPVLEVLSSGAPDGRLHFAVPVNFEVRRAPYRMYGSAGYFSRGSVFTGAAFEWAMPSGFMLTSALTQSYSTKDDPLSDQLGVGKQRMDVTAGVAYPLADIAAAYVSLGRSLTSLEEGGTSLSIAGGISFRFAGRATATP
jgi:hypothetical protein